MSKNLPTLLAIVRIEFGHRLCMCLQLLTRALRIFIAIDSPDRSIGRAMAGQLHALLWRTQASIDRDIEVRSPSVNASQKDLDRRVVLLMNLRWLEREETEEKEGVSHQVRREEKRRERASEWASCDWLAPQCSMSC